MSIVVVGDVHGKYDLYHKITREFSHTVQLGDFGFKYEILSGVDPNNHKIIGGNHENYDTIVDIPHYLGDFGFTSLNGVEFFYYRGAYSIDRQYRTLGIDWWPNEQVDVDGFMKARTLYREIRPRIVITHDCPESIASYYLKPGGLVYQNQTGYFLQEFFHR